jgi:hypothetical protein
MQHSYSFFRRPAKLYPSALSVQSVIQLPDGNRATFNDGTVELAEARLARLNRNVPICTLCLNTGTFRDIGGLRTCHCTFGQFSDLEVCDGCGYWIDPDLGPYCRRCD